MATGNRPALVLAGDIGGTKTVFGIYARGRKRPRLLVSRTYPSARTVDIVPLIEGFLVRYPHRIAAACLGAAGPVSGEGTGLTNLPLTVSREAICRRFKWHRVRVINDLVATAHAVSLLTAREMCSLNGLRLRHGANRALIAPGTGLGQSLLVFHNGKYLPLASEGGHADFAPTSDDDVNLWKYLRRTYGHVSLERVLSGSGLVNIYDWLLDSGRYAEPVRKKREADPAGAIAQGAVSGKVPVCEAALCRFISIMGAAAGNLVLTGTARGGVFLGGGIVTKILPHMNPERFLKSFVDKGRFRPFLEKVPVRIILNEKAAMLGAAHVAFEMLDD